MTMKELWIIFTLTVLAVVLAIAGQVDAAQDLLGYIN